VVESGCDAWLLHYETEDPVGYAAKWNAPLRASDPRAFAAMLDRWTRHYRRHGIEVIASGVVTLRRRTGRNWVRADEMTAAPRGAAGEHILRVFAAQDHLADVADDRALRRDVFRPVEPHRLRQTLVYREGEYAVELAELELAEGVGLTGPIEPHAAHALFRLDGRRTLGDIIDEAIEETGIDAGVLEADALRSVRRLFELGFLVREA
jgi:hypothetical protein